MNQQIKAILSKIDIHSVTDLQFRKLGSKSYLHPYLINLGGKINSDYYPYVDHQAPKDRFLGNDFYDLICLRSDELPFVSTLDIDLQKLSLINMTQTDYFPITKKAKGALATYHYITHGEKLPILMIEDQLILDRILVDSKIFCRHDQRYWLSHWKNLM